MFKKITSKLLVIIIITGLLPVVSFGVYTIYQTRLTSKQTILQSNEKLAKEVASQVHLYLENAKHLLESLAENFVHARLTPEQKQKILSNYSIQLEEFNEILIVGKLGKVKYSSGYGKDEVGFSKDATFLKALKGDFAVSNVTLSKSFRPTVVFAVPMKILGEVESVVYAEVSLFHLWKIIEDLKIGDKGFLSILTQDGRLFASGDGVQKPLAITMQAYSAYRKLQEGANTPFQRKQNDPKLSAVVEYLVVPYRLPQPFGWVVLVEQPVSEVYALATDLQKKLFMSVLFIFILSCAVGYWVSRKEFINPFRLIMIRIKELSEGKLKGSVLVAGKGEFSELAHTLNGMSEQLIIFQKKVVNEEKMAVLGHVASHLAHDIKHPIQNIDNYFRMLMRDPSNSEYMDLFSVTVNREINKMNGFLENFTSLSKNMPYVPILQQVTTVIDEVLLGVKPECDKNGIKIIKGYSTCPDLFLDKMLFNRLMSNLLKNAIEAMPDGGQISVTTQMNLQTDVFDDGAVQIQITDTGKGIPADKFEEVFSDFMSTKTSGMGLGLAITKKIIYRHGGDISVMSEEGKGTCFTLNFPLPKKQKMSA